VICKSYGESEKLYYKVLSYANLQSIAMIDNMVVLVSVLLPWVFHDMNLIDVVVIIFHYEFDGFIKKQGFAFVHVDVITGTAWNNAKQE
jgi:succinate dehydrogenase/fumarate reductase cytochrome b subunit